MKQIKLIIAILFSCLSLSSCSEKETPGSPGGYIPGIGTGGNIAQDGNGGYLFAHTGNKNGKGYYYMYYAISRDGINWTKLFKGDKALPTYYGFPYITKDDNGVWYLIGTSQGATPHYPIVWKSTDLITWRKIKDFDSAIMKLPEEYENDTNSYGAMKIFFDPVSRKFMITWHASLKGKSGDNKWRSMRTFYILTEDFNAFTKAELLLDDFTGYDEDMAQIDANIHYDEQTQYYYCVVKDERWQGDNGVGNNFKAPRICRSENLTGPYKDLSGALTNNWREAPTLTRSLDGNWWYLYVEDYTKTTYKLYRSRDIAKQSKWEKVTTMTPPDNCRHGCVVTVDETIFKELMKHI